LSALRASYKKRGYTQDWIQAKISTLTIDINKAVEKYPGRIHIANTTKRYKAPDEMMGGVFDFLGLEWRSEYFTMDALNSKRIPGIVFSMPFF
jgi:hypothetical protein